MTLIRSNSTSATRLRACPDAADAISTDSGSPAIEIDQSAGSDRSIDYGWLTDRLARALPLIGRPVRRIGVSIVNDDQMRRLHEQHCGVAQTTDVLTFDQADKDGPIDADIAVCADVAERQSAEMNHRLERELLLYIVHGLLHCCGGDDHDAAAAAAMHAEEDRILEAIGVGATYQPRTGANGEGPRP